MPVPPRYPPGVQPSNRGPLSRGGRSSISKPGSSSSANTKQALLDHIEVEDFGPPDWRTVLNRRADLGYPDFFPSRPGFNQPEDVLTEDNVKNGFTAKTFVAPTAESFSMHGPIHQHLLNGGLERLNQLGGEVLAKREEAMPVFSDRNFRIPHRVTYNETKRLQFLSDLANPSIPLHRLMIQSVPHGFKGIELLDAMFAPAIGPGGRPLPGPAKVPTDPIPIDRAVWFIRVLGANEIAAHRTRAPAAVPVSAPSPIPATPSSTNTLAPGPVVTLNSNAWYTQEFTNTFTAWMRIQLTQLSLPNRSAKAGSLPPKPTAGVLGDDKARARWIVKWEYTTSLLRELHARHLISSRILTSWMGEYLPITNLAQTGFLAQLITTHLPDMVRHIVNARICVRAVCEKIKEIRTSPAASSLAKVEASLAYIIKALVTANSEVLLSPSIWRAHAELLREITTTDDGERVMMDDYAQRNDKLLFKPATTQITTSPRRQQMEEIHKLDSLSADTNMIELCRSFFDGSASPYSATLDHARFEEKVFVLCNWAMGLFTLGGHRPYAAGSLLKLWHDERDRYLSSHSTIGSTDLFTHLFNWLDTSAAARKEEHVLAIGITFGEFTRSGLFSYGRYLQSLIARGHTARSRDGSQSHHLALLRAMPIFVVAQALLQQRRLALCGDDLEFQRADELNEQRILESFKEEVREYIPEVFGYKRYGRSAALRDSIEHRLSSPEGLTRYLFLQARFWLSPACHAHLKARSKFPAMNASTCARVLQVFRQCYGYSTTADFVIQAIRDAEDEQVLHMTFDTVHREADKWTAAERWPGIIDALMDRLPSLSAGDALHRHLVSLLRDLDAKGRLSADDAAELAAASEESEVAGGGGSHPDGSISMPAVSQLIARGDVNMAENLGKKLFTRHGPFDSWGDLWWSTIVKAVSTSAAPEVSEVALTHIATVDDVQGLLDVTIARWLDGLTPASRIDLLGQRNSKLVTIFLKLVTSRRLSALTLLSRLCYPTWKTSAGLCLTKNRQSSKAQFAIENTIILSQQLLMDVPPHRNESPVDLREALIMQTTRTEVFHDGNVSALVRHLPFLVVLQKSPLIFERTHEHVRSLIDSLGKTAEFKTASFRHLDELKDAFLSTEWSKSSNPELEDGMVDALKLIMSEGPSKNKSASVLGSIDPNARLSAWRWTRIVLEMRVEFKRLAARIETGDHAADARTTLRQLVHSSLERGGSADDADLLCEAFRGIELVVGQEILAAGLDRLCALVGQLMNAEVQEQQESTDTSIDLVLRILSSCVPSENLELDSNATTARHRLLDVLAITLQSVERQLLLDNLDLPHGIVPPQPASLFRIVLKLLRFTLGLGRSETSLLTTPRADFGRLAMSFLRVSTMVTDAGDLQDMLAYIVDSAPPQTRAGLNASFLAELSSTSVRSALEEQPALTYALPHSSPSRRTMALKPPGDEQDSNVILEDRPWELVEYMFPLRKSYRHGDLFLSSAPIKDFASVPTALFEPHFKRDVIPNIDLNDGGDSDPDWGLYAAERSLGDGLTGEPVAAKQAATCLYAGAGSSDDEDAASGLAQPQTPMTALNALSPAPSLSAVSSTARSRRASNRRTSTVDPKRPSGFSTQNAISLAKDDDEDSEDSDDDPEVVEPPPAAKRPRTGSKTTNTASSSRTTTGGKAPAKRTTGGKSVARKATGGKTVSRKATAGKAPRKR